MIENPDLHKQNWKCGAALSDPAQAREICSRVLETTASLISLLDHETQCLRRGDMEEIKSLTARKNALGVAMMKDMAFLNANAQQLVELVPEQMSILKDQHEKFSRSLQVNHEALGAVKAVSENLMRTISAAAAIGRAGPETYGANALPGTYGTLAANGRPAAMSVNRSL